MSPKRANRPAVLPADAQAIEYTQRRGVRHRGIKPFNVLSIAFDQGEYYFSFLFVGGNVADPVVVTPALRNLPRIVFRLVGSASARTGEESGLKLVMRDKLRRLWPQVVGVPVIFGDS